MSDDQWHAWMSSLDDPQPVSPQTRDRIREKAIAGAYAVADASHDLTQRGAEVIDLARGAPRVTPRRPRSVRIGLAVAAAVIAVVGVVAALVRDVPRQEIVASQFPSATSEAACRSLLESSDDLEWLRPDSRRTTLSADELQGLADAFSAFVNDLGVVGFAGSEQRQRWEDAARQLRQATVFATISDERVPSILQGVRVAVDDLVAESEHRTVVACFDDWIDGRG